MNEKTEKPKQGRPVENTVEPIRAAPEEVARAIMQNPPKKNWDYLKKERS